MTKQGWSRLAACLMAAGLTMASGPVHGQASKASDADKQFLQDFARDTNFEIATSQLALNKAHSADVKQYASMVLHDHEQLRVSTRSTDHAAGVPPVSSTSMTEEEQSMYGKLKGLSGDEFEKSYIQELVKGNDEIEKQEKSEASDSQLAPVKALAQKAADTDQKHASKAKDLAKAHHISS